MERACFQPEHISPIILAKEKEYKELLRYEARGAMIRSRFKILKRGNVLNFVSEKIGHYFRRRVYVLDWRTVSALTGGLLWCLFPSCEATREMNTKITLEWAQKQFVTRVHTLFYFLHDITKLYMTIKTTIFTYHRVSLARFSFSWWRDNRLLMMSQWPDNCGAITWILISNSLDIDFIHGDIHGRSCKETILPISCRINSMTRGPSHDCLGVNEIGKLDYWQKPQNPTKRDSCAPLFG